MKNPNAPLVYPCQTLIYLCAVRKLFLYYSGLENKKEPTNSMLELELVGFLVVIAEKRFSERAEHYLLFYQQIGICLVHVMPITRFNNQSRQNSLFHLSFRLRHDLQWQLSMNINFGFGLSVTFCLYLIFSLPSPDF